MPRKKLEIKEQTHEMALDADQLGERIGKSSSWVRASALYKGLPYIKNNSGGRRYFPSEVIEWDAKMLLAQAQESADGDSSEKKVAKRGKANRERIKSVEDNIARLEARITDIDARITALSDNIRGNQIKTHRRLIAIEVAHRPTGTPAGNSSDDRLPYHSSSLPPLDFVQDPPSARVSPQKRLDSE